jgi:hypothetical protein
VEYGEIDWLGMLELGSASAFLLKMQATQTETLWWIMVSLFSLEMLMLNSSRTVSENA